MLNNLNSLNGDSSLKKNKQKRPFSGVASEFARTSGMLIPSISKAKRNYFGVSSLGTNDYRHGAEIRLLKKFKSNGNEVLKKKEHLCSGSRMIFSRSVVHKKTSTLPKRSFFILYNCGITSILKQLIYLRVIYFVRKVVGWI